MGGEAYPWGAIRIAITGGTGFVGGHLAAALSRSGHEAVLIARGVDRRPWAKTVRGLPGVRVITAGVDDRAGLVRAFQGSDGVAHCAGINREIGKQTYEAIHIRGTETVVRAAEQAGIRRLAQVSFLRARPDGASGYHRSKWAAEQIVRASTLDWTVLKPGMMFGRGDHMLDHLTRALSTLPVFIGVGRRRVRPLAVGDAVAVVEAALLDGQLSRKTVALTGPTELLFDDAVRLVAQVIGKRRAVIDLPIAVSYGVAWLAERAMTVPLISQAQVRILEEEVVEPTLAPDTLPTALTPSTAFDAASIRAGLPDDRGFGWSDFRWGAPSRD